MKTSVSPRPAAARVRPRAALRLGPYAPLLEFCCSAPSSSAFQQFGQYFAWLQEDIVTVLAPEADARQFSYDRRTHRLEPLSSVNAEVARDALAHVLMPAWLYREQRYRMRTNPTH